MAIQHEETPVSAVQDEFVIEAYGEIVGPPTLESVLDKIRTSCQFKQWLELSPAELRVLIDHLDT